MSDTERELLRICRLHDDILRERAEGLRDGAQAFRERLLQREEALARLRTQVAALRATMRQAPVPVQTVQPAPMKEAASVSASASASSTEAGSSWRRAAPYAAIVAIAAFVELGGTRRAAQPPARDLAGLVRPAPAPVLREHAAAKGVPVVADEDRSQEALLLVHEWTLPGDERTLGERLGGSLDLPGGRPAWSVERTAEHAYRVSFRGGEGATIYSFEADVSARVVWPSAETQDMLAPRFAAALRDDSGR